MPWRIALGVKFMLLLCVPLPENNLIASYSHMYTSEFLILRVLWLKVVQTHICSFKFFLGVPTQYMLLHTVFLSASIHSLLSSSLCVSFNIAAINISYCYSLILSLGIGSWISLSWHSLWLCLWRSLKKCPYWFLPDFFLLKSRAALCAAGTQYIISLMQRNHKPQIKVPWCDTHTHTGIHSCKHGDVKPESWFQWWPEIWDVLRQPCDLSDVEQHINPIILVKKHLLT